MAQQFIRLSDVKAITGLSRTTVYRLAADGSFPKPLRITKRSSGWILKEVEDWIDKRIQEERPNQVGAN